MFHELKQSPMTGKLVRDGSQSSLIFCDDQMISGSFFIFKILSFYRRDRVPSVGFCFEKDPYNGLLSGNSKTAPRNRP
jgi:hypothetical protein